MSPYIQQCMCVLLLLLGFSLCVGLRGCVWILVGSRTGWTGSVWTPRSPQGAFSLPVPYCKLLLGLKSQRHKAIRICHQNNPQGSWRKQTGDQWLRRVYYTANYTTPRIVEAYILLMCVSLGQPVIATTATKPYAH